MDISSSLQRINRHIKSTCPGCKSLNHDVDLKNFGIKELDIDNPQGKTILANRVKRILKQINPDCNPEQLLRQLREKNVIKPFKSKFSSKLSGKYYLSSIIDYIKSQQNSQSSGE